MEPAVTDEIVIFLLGVFVLVAMAETICWAFR
jgi:hypothetical protein